MTRTQQDELATFYIDEGTTSAKRLKDEAEKREQQRLEAKHFDALAELRKRERLDAQREEAEKNLKLSAQTTFLEANLSATVKDFERIYPKLRDEILANNFLARNQENRPSWESELN